MLAYYTIHAETFAELTKKFEKALATIDFQPTLGFCFTSVKQPLNEIMRLFNDAGIDLFGASSSGEILFTKEEDFISDNSTAIILTDLNKDYYDLSVLNRGDLDSTEFGKMAGRHIREAFPEPSVLIATGGLTIDGQALVEGVLNTAGEKLVMFGGMAGDDGMFKETFAFSAGEITDNGAVILTFDKKHVKLSGLAYSGWVSLGADLKVTRSEGNVVYEIDNQPALDVYTDYLSVDEDDLPSIGLEYPLMIKRKGVTHGPLRAVLNVDKQHKTLIFAGSVPEGSTISFSSSPGFEILESTREKIIDYYEKNPVSDLLILFSCIARHMALGPMIAQEIKLASIKWGKPVIGFFTYGEIGNNQNNTCDFYNQTFTLATINVV